MLPLLASGLGAAEAKSSFPKRLLPRGGTSLPEKFCAQGAVEHIVFLSPSSLPPSLPLFCWRKIELRLCGNAVSDLATTFRPARLLTQTLPPRRGIRHE